MKIRTINFKKNNINATKLSSNILVFLRTTKFNSQYVNFTIKITTESRRNEFYLVSNITVDLQDYQTKVGFKSLVVNNYIKNLSKLKTTKEDKLIIFYSNVSKDKY